MINAILHLRNWLLQNGIEPDCVACVTVEFTGPDRADLASRILRKDAGVSYTNRASTAVETIAGIPLKIVGRAL